MSFSSKNFILFILTFIGLAACMYLLMQNLFIAAPISLFLSICFFYDPKKYEKSKKKYESNLENK